MRLRHIIGLIVAVAFLLAMSRLVALENGGPPHSFLELPGHEPATLYLPGGTNPFFTALPAPPTERPAAVVLVHGFMADRQTMSVLARRIAENGYAVIAIDVQGHGENRNPLGGGPVASDTLHEDVQRAVDFLRAYPLVDGSRIVVMGHSMGAGAALDYATHDATLKGAVMISGGFRFPGPERPRNALFIFAEHDPEQIRSASAALAAHLAGVPHLDDAKTYGEFGPGTAVEAVQVPGVDHVQIVYSAAAARTIVQWLDSAFGTSRQGAIDIADPRLAVSGVALALFVILLVPLGRICGAMTPMWARRPAGARGWVGLLLVGGALCAAMPLVALTPPAAFVPLVVGDIQLSWFAVAGVMLIIGLVWAQPLEWPILHTGFSMTLLAAALGLAAVYACQASMSVTFHRLTLTPERLLAALVGSLLLLPFWIGFEFLVRRGGPVISTTLAILGRGMIVVLMLVGIRLQVLPFVLILVLPSIALIFVMIEIFAASAYAASRNLLLITLVESCWFAWVIAATNPITLMF